MIFTILYLLFNISNAYILIIQRSNFYNKQNSIKMEYENYKNYDDNFKNYDGIINFLPSFQASIIVNNWLSNIDYDNIDYNDFKDDNDSYDIFMKKSIYDMKVYIAINKNKKNTVLLAWTPEYANKRSVAYIAGGKIANNTLFLERIAQNPYYYDILKLKCSDFFNEIKKVINTSSYNLSLDEINNYDQRYKLSLLIEEDN